VIAELKGKMAEFADMPSHAPSKAAKPLSNIEKEALEILMQLGESASVADMLIDKALKSDDSIVTTEQLVQAVYRLKA
ncbi:MAG: hypothetical protein JXM68_14260, partial [Sedimentisphaerales bacterium]|nr:hypothetical protein [Sedimentisphaerales bacterium]